jgi:ABC-2 type transport system ATP-binding protein
MAASASPAIQIEDLYVQYGSLVAVKGVSFDVGTGECFGLLGPNGAGKTSTLSVIEGLRVPARGRVTVAGHDIRREATKAKRVIGVQLQSSQYFPDLTTIELIQLTASFYRLFPSRKQALAQLERWGLGEKAGAKVGQLSGGQQQRLTLVLALVNDPQIVLLDEPTTGLDPQARRSIWQQVRQLKSEGRTVVLTTHYIEEAEMLCQRIGIIDHGALIALDTPEALIARLGAASTLTTTLALMPDQLAAVRALPGATSVTYEEERLEIQTTQPIDTLVALQQLAIGAGRPIRDVNIRQPNLEDVFISLTGHAIRD